MSLDKPYGARYDIVIPRFSNVNLYNLKLPGVDNANNYKKRTR